MSPRVSIERFRPTFPSWIRLWLADSALLVVSQALTIVATSSAAILIARHLDPRDWGIFSGFFGLSMAVAVVVQFGTGTWLLRELSKLFAAPQPGADESAARLVKAALVVNALIASTLVTAGVVVAVLRHVEVPVVVALGALLSYSGLVGSASLMEMHLRSQRRVRRVAAATLLEKYLLVTLVIAVSVLGWGVAAIGVGYVIAGCSRVAFVRWSVFHGRGLERRLPKRADVSHVLRKSLPFAISNSCHEVLPRLDTFLLLALSATSAGYFAIGDRMLGPAVIFPVVLSATLWPFFAASKEHLSPPWPLVLVFAGGGAVLAIAVIVTAPSLVPFIFGQKYADAIPAVRVFALAFPFAFALEPLRVYGFSRHQERRVMMVFLTGALVGMVGIVGGQWAFGVVAAAAAYVLRQALFLFGLVLVSVKAAGIRAEPTPPTVGPIGVASP